MIWGVFCTFSGGVWIHRVYIYIYYYVYINICICFFISDVFSVASWQIFSTSTSDETRSLACHGFSMVPNGPQWPQVAEFPWPGKGQFIIWRFPKSGGYHGVPQVMDGVWIVIPWKINNLDGDLPYFMEKYL